MFGQHVDTRDLDNRLVALENLVMTNLPRIASCESLTVSLQEKQTDLEARLAEMLSQRDSLPKQPVEPEGSPAPAPAPATHRGEGCLPPPAPARGFSPGQISPKGSLKIEPAPRHPEPPAKPPGLGARQKIEGGRAKSAPTIDT